MKRKPLRTFLASLMVVALVGSDLAMMTAASGQPPQVMTPTLPPGMGTPSYPSPYPSFGPESAPPPRNTAPPVGQAPPSVRLPSPCQANGGYRLEAFPKPGFSDPLGLTPRVTQVSAQGSNVPANGPANGQTNAQAPQQFNNQVPQTNSQFGLQTPPLTPLPWQGQPQQQQQTQPAPDRQRSTAMTTSILQQEYEDLSRIEAVFNADVLQLLGVNPAPRQFPYVPPGSTSAPIGSPQTPFAAQPIAMAASAPPVQGPFGTFGTPLRQYGYQMFANNVTTFAPVDDMPVGPDYVVGPGDDLSINVWGPVDSTLVRTVDRNGRIVLPKVGDLRVWGMTFSEADRLIREQLARYFRGFQTSVTMGRLRTVRVHVVGEVCQPGVYTFSSLSTVTNALYGAGGPTKLGSLRNVRLLRNHHVVGTLDLYDFLQRGDRTRDFRLESGDTIFVPTIGDVATVAGEVKRPAIYEVRGDVRLSDVIEMAGGVTPGSYLKRVQVVRAQPSAERVTLDVDMSRYYLKREEASNPVVQGGDLVLVHRSDARIYNTVKVDGAVKYPGLYELKPTMRISELLPPDTLLPEAHSERVEIARRRPDLTLEIVSVNLKKAWAGDREADVTLRALDEVAVRTEFRASRTVTLAGQVARPGDYTIADGERLSSVIERAGGFTDKAFLTGAVFTRAALRATEQEQLQSFVQLQEKAIMATASTTIVGAEKEEVLSQQSALNARRELLRSLASRVTVGRMVVRLDDVSKLRGTSDDIVLVEGDYLQIPEPPSSVLVIGAVRTSTSVLYKPGADLEYYVNRVGGFSKEADKKETHIVKADGSAIASFAKVRAIDPGDTIMVPPKEEEKIRVLPTVRDVMQTIGSAILSFAALAVLF